MSAERTSIGPYYDELRSALDTLQKLPPRAETITFDQLQEASFACTSLKTWIKLNPDDKEGRGAERTVAVKVIRRLQRACARDWECQECRAAFDLNFDDLDEAGDEPHCTECGSVDIDVSTGKLPREED